MDMTRILKCNMSTCASSMSDICNSEQPECRASSINVTSHDRHADCETFQSRS